MTTTIARLETNVQREAEIWGWGGGGVERKRENVKFERKGRGRKKEGSEWVSRQESVVLE